LQAEAAAENTFAAAERVTPQTKPFSASGSKFELNLPANSVTVLRIGVGR
jgi:hypothetical protein